MCARALRGSFCNSILPAAARSQLEFFRPLAGGRQPPGDLALLGTLGEKAVVWISLPRDKLVGASSLFPWSRFAKLSYLPREVGFFLLFRFLAGKGLAGSMDGYGGSWLRSTAVGSAAAWTFSLVSGRFNAVRRFASMDSQSELSMTKRAVLQLRLWTMRCLRRVASSRKPQRKMKRFAIWCRSSTSKVIRR